MELNEYQAEALSTAIYPNDNKVEYLALALCGEAGEVADKVKKIIRAQMENFKQGTVAKTLGIAIDDSKLHDALYDIEVCKAIYDIVCARY